MRGPKLGLHKYVIALVLGAFLTCNNAATRQLLDADFLLSAGKYFTVNADSIAYANQGFRVTVTAHFSGGTAEVKNYGGDVTFTVAGAGTIQSAIGPGWKDGSQTFTLIYQNANLSPGATSQLAVKAQATDNAGIVGTSNNVTMGGPINTIETVYEETFESGLAAWNQQAGVWPTTTPAVNGLALKSPTGASAQTFTITTVNNIDLTSKNNCILSYEARFDLDHQQNINATLFFAGNIIGQFKNTAINSSNPISSGSVFVPRKYFLGGGISGKLSIVTIIGASNPVDIRLDNITVTCNNTPWTSYVPISDNFESGTTGWSLGAPWTNTAAQGASTSTAPYANLSSPFNSTTYLTRSGNINLVGHSGCKLRQFWKVTNTGNSSNFIGLVWNTFDLDYQNNTYAGYLEYWLTAFEGTSTNQLKYYCYEDASSGAGSIQCAIDEVEITCQQ